jgi:hypothetical protein
MGRHKFLPLGPHDQRDIWVSLALNPNYVVMLSIIGFYSSYSIVVVSRVSGVGASAI